MFLRCCSRSHQCHSTAGGSTTWEQGPAGAAATGERHCRACMRFCAMCTLGFIPGHFPPAPGGSRGLLYVHLSYGSSSCCQITSLVLWHRNVLRYLKAHAGSWSLHEQLLSAGAAAVLVSLLLWARVACTQQHPLVCDWHPYVWYVRDDTSTPSSNCTRSVLYCVRALLVLLCGQAGRRPCLRWQA
jgi:hypothetical protein